MAIIESSTEAMQAAQELIDAGQEITAEGSATRVVLYHESIILANRLSVMILCARCGHGKSGFVTDASGELSPREVEQLLKHFQSLPMCHCHEQPRHNPVEKILERFRAEQQPKEPQEV